MLVEHYVIAYQLPPISKAELALEQMSVGNQTARDHYLVFNESGRFLGVGDVARLPGRVSRSSGTVNATCRGGFGPTIHWLE